MSICITAIIRSKEGHAMDLRPFLLDLVRESRKESACLWYELYQSVDNENLFVLHEEWPEEVWLQYHVRQDHVLNFKEAAEPLLAEEITVFRIERIF